MSRMVSIFLVISSIVMLVSCEADKLLEAKQSVLNVASYVNSRQLLDEPEPVDEPLQEISASFEPTMPTTQAPATQVPTPSPTPSPTTQAPTTPSPIMPTDMPSSHVVALGQRSPEGNWLTGTHCAQDVVRSYEGDIAVRCCFVDYPGSIAESYDVSDSFAGNCFGQAKNFWEAKEICEADGQKFPMRLCTVQEVVDVTVLYVGCYESNGDILYTWTSDECGNGLSQAMNADKIAHEGDELNTHDHTDNKDGGNGIVIGIVSAAVVFALALSLGALFCHRRRQAKAKGIEIEEENVEPELAKDASGTSTGQTEIVELNGADDMMVEDEVY